MLNYYIIHDITDRGAFKVILKGKKWHLYLMQMILRSIKNFNEESEEGIYGKVKSSLTRNGIVNL